MKYIIVSDIHGSLDSIQILINKFHQYNCDKILILGDITVSMQPNIFSFMKKKNLAAELLNSYKDKIIAAKGNCDSPSDESILDFKLEDIVKIEKEDKMIYLTHGHLYGPNKLVPGASFNDIVFYGHTHIAKIENIKDVYYINPGSITSPRDDKERSFIIFHEKTIKIYDIYDNIINQIKI